MRYFTILLFALLSNLAFSQNDTLTTTLHGTVVHNETKLPINNVHVINTTKVSGTISDGNGYFEINAKINDTLLFSYLGFETLKVKVTNDWVKNKSSKITLTEKAYALEEVIISKYNLTGYVEVDTKLIPVDENTYRYSISGLDAGYEAGDKSPSAVTKVLGAIFNPADFLYNAFGKRPKQMRKLREMKKDDTVRELLSTKFDRETLAALLEIDKDDIPLILQNCNYSEYFIKSANDLQILEAISSCYEEYKILKKNK
ncbi:membrane protein [Flavobacterium sp. 316]|uniref:Carboxypeptidase-like regulatory domain-containing protein n=1 Tax=Flavobacterium sediminilitoris TaxID=2024526 RepID=A0ABY4HL58_9FLAO|nr:MULTISPECIES: carboxypeptidase-like regulatory domain-containing protein [Flavobacterium]KIX21961.1 membrane protein [Flavobacterium sp. 316]UOX32214.1 carboxypeptidase-like regulatory domain-containing protein [Flavobacterium sediminilitoris]